MQLNVKMSIISKRRSPLSRPVLRERAKCCRWHPNSRAKETYQDHHHVTITDEAIKQLSNMPLFDQPSALKVSYWSLGWSSSYWHKTRFQRSRKKNCWHLDRAMMDGKWKKAAQLLSRACLQKEVADQDMWWPWSQLSVTNSKTDASTPNPEARARDWSRPSRFIIDPLFDAQSIGDPWQQASDRFFHVLGPTVSEKQN